MRSKSKSWLSWIPLLVFFVTTGILMFDPPDMGIKENERRYQEGLRKPWGHFVNMDFVHMDADAPMPSLGQPFLLFKIPHYHCRRGHHSEYAFLVDGENFCPVCFRQFLSRHVSRAVMDKQ